MTTEQESFWAGDFGRLYTERNAGDALRLAKATLFDEVFLHTGEIESVIELGANRGLNLHVIKSNMPDVRCAAVEINRDACEIMRREMSDTTVYPASLLDFITDETFDLSFTMGVLIHIAPDDLRRAYRTLYNTSHRYILVAEYYSPKPVEIEYRGHAGRLWKRDFAGEMLDTYPDLRLLDYGFRYHRDPQHPMDDISWFLMEKGQ